MKEFLERRLATISMPVLMGTLMAFGGCKTPEKQVDLARAEDPPMKVPRSYSVKAGSLPITTSFGTMQGYLAQPSTSYESPYIVMLTNSLSLEEEWQREAERIAGAGYVVACLPRPDFQDARDQTMAWGEQLQRTVEYLESLPETDQRNGGAIGYGNAGARALQLSLVSPEIVAAVAWQPPAISGGKIVPNIVANWLIVATDEEFKDEKFQDWLVLSGVDYRYVELDSEADSGTEIFGIPTDVDSYYSKEADRIRGIQSLFLLEKIGSTDSPSYREMERVPSEEETEFIN